MFNHSSDITDFKDQKFVYGRVPTYTETCNIIGLRDQFAITDSSHRFWVYPKRAASGTKREFLGVVYVKCSLFHQLNADWTLKCIIVQPWLNVFKTFAQIAVRTYLEMTLLKWAGIRKPWSFLWSWWGFLRHHEIINLDKHENISLWNTEWRTDRP